MVIREADSLTKKERIVDAAISVLADFGICRMTHRKIAETAKISLSSTTYYYKSKQDILNDAVYHVLHRYMMDIRSNIDFLESGQIDSIDPANLLIALMGGGTGRDRTELLSWWEIMLDSARTPEGHVLARTWYPDMDAAWGDLAHVAGMDTDSVAIHCLIDATAGFLLFALALGLSSTQILDVIRGGNPIEKWGLVTAPQPEGARKKLGKKSIHTREKLVDAAIELLVEGGVGAVSYQAVAERSGVAMTAPAYHFGKLSNLLAAAQTKLFAGAKSRLQEGFALLGEGNNTDGALTDISTAIFTREATEFGLEAVAHYFIWVEAARNPDLRPMMADAILDKIEARQRQLLPVSVVSPSMALLCEAFFVGWLLRAVSTGGSLDLLVTTRQHFDLIFRLLPEAGSIDELFHKLFRVSKAEA